MKCNNLLSMKNQGSDTNSRNQNFKPNKYVWKKYRRFLHNEVLKLNCKRIDFTWICIKIIENKQFRLKKDLEASILSGWRRLQILPCMASIRRRCTQNSDMPSQFCDYSSDCSLQSTQDSCGEDIHLVRKKKQRRTIQGVFSGIHGTKKRKYGGGQNALMAALKSCAKKKDLNEVRRIHADILNWGLLENDVYLGNALVNLYVRRWHRVQRCRRFTGTHCP